MKYILLFLTTSILLFVSNTSKKRTRFQAHYTTSAPKIDGNANDPIWDNIPTWYSDHYIWKNNVGSQPDSSDFSWRYKLAWDENKFYILAEITDDQLTDRHSIPTVDYWKDDCFEVLFDEDHSGGNHKHSYQAFVYHISTSYDAIDIDNEGKRVLLNDHLEIQMDTVNGKYVWESAFDIYDKNYNSTSKSTPVELYQGKVMGWGMAYCDSDSKEDRDHFFGSHYISGEDKNLTWKSADAFGEVELIKK